MTIYATIEVDDLTLDGLVDIDGVQGAFDTIDGWHDGPGVDVAQVQRVGSHGQFAQAGHRTGRVIAVGGWLSADTRAPLFTAVQRLATVLADGGFSTLTVTDIDGPTLTASVQLLDKPDVRWDQPTLCRFQLQFLAPDPYRYGLTSSASAGLFTGSQDGTGMVWDAFPSGNADFNTDPDSSLGVVTVSNDGNATASVVFSVTGETPADGFRITDLVSGESISYFGSVVPVGSTIVFDGRDGTVLIDGTADRSGATVVTGWPTVAPGSSGSFLFESLGGATDAMLTVSVVAAYW